MRGRFYVSRKHGGVFEVYDGGYIVDRCLLVLGPPRGYELSQRVCIRLNELGDLGQQAVELDGTYAFDKLALKYLNEEHLTTVVENENGRIDNRTD